MRVHITNLYGISYSCASRVAMNNTVEIAKQMNFHELGFFKYPVQSDSEAELNSRLDGIIAGLWHDDIVVFQFPSWNGFTFDEAFCEKVKAYLNTKLIIYAHDIVPLMFDKNEDNIRRVVQILNRADVLILPSENMYNLLKTYGLNIENVLYQEVWDYPISEHMEPSPLNRKMFFPEQLERFPYILNWKGKTPVEVFDNTDQASNNPNLIVNNVLPSAELVFKFSSGGFGLLWAEDTQKEYYQYNNPFKLGTYLAAGIPVIVQAGTHAADYVSKHKVGFVVNSLQEADDIVQNITEDEYRALSRNVEKVSFLVRNGYYTRSVLNDAVKLCMEDNLSNPAAHEINTIPENLDDLIQVAFGLYDKTGKYSSYVGTVMESILENTHSKICFHIFHDSTLSDDNKQKLLQVAANHGSYVIFHLIDSSVFDADNKWIKTFTVGTMFRLLMPRHLPNIDKIIYLDGDLLFNRDINELWNVDISSRCLAAVSDYGIANGRYNIPIVTNGIISKDRYFNAGVLLLNLNNIRKKGDLLELSLEYLNNNPDSPLPDQDALNYYFNDNTLLLDNDWNVFVSYEKEKTFQVREDVVYHFAGINHINFHNPSEYEKLYYKMRGRTPWGFDMLEQDVFMGYSVLSSKINNLQELLPKISSGCKKIFYGPQNYGMTNILKMMPPNKKDYFITDNLDDAGTTIDDIPVKYIDEIKKEKPGKYVVLVVPDGNALENLEKMGLTSGQDYFAIPNLLVGTQGGYASFS